LIAAQLDVAELGGPSWTVFKMKLWYWVRRVAVLTGTSDREL